MMWDVVKFSNIPIYLDPIAKRRTLWLSFYQHYVSKVFKKETGYVTYLYITVRLHGAPSLGRSTGQPRNDTDLPERGR
jgi:hypothetical protein